MAKSRSDLPAGSYRLEPSGITLRSAREAAAMQRKRRGTKPRAARKNQSAAPTRAINALKQATRSSPPKGPATDKGNSGRIR